MLPQSATCYLLPFGRCPLSDPRLSFECSRSRRALAHQLRQGRKAATVRGAHCCSVRPGTLTRENAAKASVDQIRQQQAASGFGLRQDVAASLSRMEAYMDAAERAVQGENPQAARKSMDQAEKEIDNLETFLGR